jgi:peptidoglycan/xylan/chitin deacetylase (PgdA/CDA1 family)
VLHALTVAARHATSESTQDGDPLAGSVAGASGPLGAWIVAVDAPDDEIRAAHESLDADATTPEATAVLLRRRGFELRCGEPAAVGETDVLEWASRQGRDSVAVLRADASLVGDLRIGTWFASRAVTRLGRRLPLARRARVADDAALESAFWRGVRGAASGEEWRRLTRGYSVLLYHRLAGERKPGQERLDVPPDRFARQLALLRLIGFRPLPVEQLLAFHRPGGGALGRLRFVVTVDDALQDVLEPLLAAASARPCLFVPTGVVGGEAQWLDGERVAGWDELLLLAASGIELGSHGRTHAPLPDLDDASIRREVEDSRRELREALGHPPRLFAYPNGRTDARTRAAVVEAGYEGAFTTQPGLNGAGTDRHLLRRVSVKRWDSGVSLAWKALTGQPLPAAWERWLVFRDRVRGLRARSGRRGD